LTIRPSLAFVFQALSAEVQQQADLNAGSREVVHQLDFMRRNDGLNGLFFHQLVR
jgi:hypothetical protein